MVSGVIRRLGVSMYYLRLIQSFIRASLQEELAYPVNFFINILQSLLNFGTGIVGLVVIFNQVNTIHGWTFSSTLALLGVYLLLSALRTLFIGPSLDSLAGLDGDIWQGRFDFTLLRPVNVQFFASVRVWHVFSSIDLLLGTGTLIIAVVALRQTFTWGRLLLLLITLGAGTSILYAILLIFAALLFWSPGFLFTWVFDGLFQTARYPVGLYPNWLRFILTWIVPIGVMTTVPAQAITGQLSLIALIGSVLAAIILFTGASMLFQAGLRRYGSASS